MRQSKTICILLMTLFMMNGCAIIQLQKDNTFSMDSCLITGSVYARDVVSKPVIVVAYENKDGKASIAHYTVLHQPGPFELLVPQGRCRIFAFEDANQNLIPDKDELAGSMAGESINAYGGGLVENVAIVLEKDGRLPADIPKDALARYAGNSFRWHSTQAGAIMDIDSPLFSAQQGETGFWSPFEFFRELGANIYFLEPYDPRKIPVLLIHGAAGSPQDWRFFIGSIDRTKYQVWIYYYPSGARLKSMSDIMSAKLIELHKRYQFENLYITAHSMGGIVSRYALVSRNAHRAYTRLFISISTPFGGEELAESGVAKSPAVIPSWRDMSPGSEFIKMSFANKIPLSIKDYLFFGHKGSRNPLRPNNDSTVTLVSMLDPRAQAEALKVFGFNEDHVGILNSAHVFEQYRSLLESVDSERISSAAAKKRGKIRFRYSLNQSSDVPPLWMMMFFVPREENRVLFTLEPDPLKTDQEIGPVAEGIYDVGMLAWGYKPNPSMRSIRVEKEGIVEMHMGLEPQGMAGGQILMKLEKDDLYWGFMPTVRDRRKRIKTISLTGGGMQRRIIPGNMNIDQAVQAILNNRDYFYEDWFIFFDLPGGQYRLTIEADGFASVVKTINVDPKVVPWPLKIMLSP